MKNLARFLAALLMLGACATTIPGKTTLPPTEAPAPPVTVAIHGYALCPTGFDPVWWQNIQPQFPGLVMLATHRCDPGGIRVPGTEEFDHNTPINEIAHAVAWYLWDLDQPLDLIGYSMGGLVLRSIADHLGQPHWPESLPIQQVATLSTPHLGMQIDCSAHPHAQCTELSPGSEFTQSLRQPEVGQWHVFGATNCDSITVESSTAVPGAVPHVYDCLTHGDYLWSPAVLADLTQALNR